MLTPRRSRLPLRLSGVGGCVAWRIDCACGRKSIDEQNTTLDYTLRDDLTVIKTFVANLSCSRMETCGQRMTNNHSGKMIRLSGR